MKSSQLNFEDFVQWRGGLVHMHGGLAHMHGSPVHMHGSPAHMHGGLASLIFNQNEELIVNC